jgi:hypothetical protein
MDQTPRMRLTTVTLSLSETLAISLTLSLIALKIALTGATFMVPLYIAVGGCLFGLDLNRFRISKSTRRVITIGVLTGFSFLSVTSALAAHALFFDTLDGLLNTTINAFGIGELNPIRGWIVNLLRLAGLATVAGIFVAALRSRPGDDEENASNTKRFIKIVGYLLIGDLTLSLMG